MEEESIKILKIVALIANTEEYQEIHNHFWTTHKSRVLSKKYRWTRNYLIEEINQNELMSKRHKKVCTTLDYIKQFLTLASAITGSVSISAFSSLVGIPVRITSSAIGLKIFAITTGIKKKTQ